MHLAKVLERGICKKPPRNHYKDGQATTLEDPAGEELDAPEDIRQQ